MRGWIRAGLAALTMLGAATAQPALAACEVAKVAELPITLINQRALIEAKFGDREARFIVDSGAFFSTISRASAAEFGLTISPAPSWFRMTGIGGQSMVSFGHAKDFTLAGISIPKTDFIVGGSDTGTAGLVGQNILAYADTEYDLPHSAVRLMKVAGCGKMALAYWAGAKPFSTLDLEKGDGSPWKPHIIATVLVNGVKMRALFDTGATGTLITRAAARRAGITPDSPGVTRADNSAGLGSREVASWIVPFDKIDLGGEIASHPKLRMIDDQMDVDMLIGIDFFRTHRIFVSNANHKLYMTYEGGPVFGLKPSGARTATGAKLDLTDKTADPTDAEGWSRRGAASLSKGLYAQGLADLDKAVALAPTVGRYVYLRAEAHLDNDQPLLARQDLDKAAALMPADTDVRLMRAGLRLHDGDAKGAAEDLKVADAGLAAGSDRRLVLGNLFDGVDDQPAAIANFDAWLKLHGQDPERATAYNGRCFSRALLNRELDRAMADCTTALRLRPGDPAILDSRGLVELRLGKLAAAKADYDAALKANPREAWTLYMRANLHKRMGDAAKAEEDRKAALAIDPDVAKRARTYGLES